MTDVERLVGAADAMALWKRGYLTDLEAMARLRSLLRQRGAVSMSRLVYVAGPITKPEPMENMHNAITVATVLLDSGVVTPFVPHLTCFWHCITPRPYETWLAYDFDVIRRCDALLRIPGESLGADREVALAGRLQLPVFHDVDDVIAWASAQ